MREHLPQDLKSKLVNRISQIDRLHSDQHNSHPHNVEEIAYYLGFDLANHQGTLLFSLDLHLK